MKPNIKIYGTAMGTERFHKRDYKGRKRIKQYKKYFKYPRKQINKLIDQGVDKYEIEYC